MSKNIIDYTKYFSKVVARRRDNMIRQCTNIYMTSETAKVSFGSGMPNNSTFPFEEISFIFKDGIESQLIGQDLATSLQYHRSQGHPPLINKWKEFQRKWHSPKFEAWDVCTVAGSQEGCSKIFEMFIEKGQPVMLQSPTYTGILGAVQPLESDFIEISQDEDGIIPEDIIRVCEERLENHRSMPKLLYVNPVGGNPTGSMLSENRCKLIYKLARKYDFLILEDDPYCFVHFLDHQPKSLFSLDTEGRVIRLDSFSKTVSAGIRLGTVTAHRDIIKKLVQHIESSTLQTSSMSQMIVYKLLDRWSMDGLEKHYQDIQQFYKKKRDMMRQGLEKHLKDLAEWSVPQGGMFFWIKIPEIEDTYNLVFNKLIPNGLLVIPGHAFNYNPQKRDQHLRLCYSFVNEKELDEGMSILSKCIREEIQDQN